MRSDDNMRFACKYFPAMQLYQVMQCSLLTMAAIRNLMLIFAALQLKVVQAVSQTE